MKKLLFILSAAFILTVGLFSFSASAERTTWTPVSLCENNVKGGDVFTITKWDIYKPYLLSGENQYKKSLDFDVYGYFGNSTSANGSMDFILYCYDSSGNHIDTQYFTITAEDYDSYIYEYGSYQSFIVPDVTASVEIAARYPGSWSNTLFKSEYRNVWSADGRVMAIPTLMLPVYENVGWYGDVELWALDGRYIEVPYPDAEKYKQVGWYEYNDYRIRTFRTSYKQNLAAKDYSAIMIDVEDYLYDLEGTQYAQELYAAKTYAMDAWRKESNAPLAVYSNSVYQSSGDTIINLSVRNISYKTVKAFRIGFTCYDVFGRVVMVYSDYYTDDTWLLPSESETYTWERYGDDIEYISEPEIMQVVYSDNTS